MFDANSICGISSESKSSNDQFNKKYLKQESQQMIRTSLHSYEEAIKALNKLQSNAQTIKKSILSSAGTSDQTNNLDETIKYLNRSGLTLNDLDKLHIIHVSGTKGKGSTCALTESILHSFDVRTGFFSSPHLISVTERFRINCKPISKEKFTPIFWKVYNRLENEKKSSTDMPAYFKFLTILSFHIFIEEQVDVVVLEVGIGGEKDCTNIVRNTKTVGITSLGLEHQTLLGNTLSEIAWQKAGIIKENSSVFTTLQPEECMTVLRQRADEKNAKIFVAPDFNLYKWSSQPKLQITSKVQYLNASLATQLAYNWLRQNKMTELNGYANKSIESNVILETSEKLKTGLETCFWPGRCQIFDVRNFKIYLDGAHTIESIEICIDWFNEYTKSSTHKKALIFNTTGDRDSMKLMKKLMDEIEFLSASFVPNIPFYDMEKSNDNISVLHPSEEQITRATSHANYWNQFKKNNKNGKSYLNILDALKSIDNVFNKNEKVHILITGSLHLVGASILALEKFDKLEI